MSEAGKMDLDEFIKGSALAVSNLQLGIQSLRTENDNLRRIKGLQNAVSEKEERIKTLTEINKDVKNMYEERIKELIEITKDFTNMNESIKELILITKAKKRRIRIKDLKKDGRKKRAQRHGQRRLRSSAWSGDGKEVDCPSGDRKFTFNEKIEGKNVMVANELAVVSKGDVPSFVKPLQANQDSIAHKNAEIPGKSGSGSSPPVNLPDVKGTFVGNENVNVQTNIQKVYLPGSANRDHGGKDSDKKTKYRKADKEELAQFLHQCQNKSAEHSEYPAKEQQNAIGCEHSEYPAKEQQNAISCEGGDFQTKSRTHQLNRVRRLATLLSDNPKSDHFPDLIALLATLPVIQQRSLLPQLSKISRIYFDGCQVNYQHLKSFFKLFKDKRYEVLSLRNTYLGANNVHMLSSSLESSCKVSNETHSEMKLVVRYFHSLQISCLDLGSCCSFGSTFFLVVALLLPSVDSVVFSGLTSSRIFPEYGLFSPRQFSRKEAQHLADNITGNQKAIDLNLSNCDLRKLEIATSLSTCLSNVLKLTLKNCEFTGETISVMFENMQNMRMVDFACSKVRNPGVQAVSRYLSKVKVLVLSNVMLDEEGVQPLVDALRSLQREMDVLDISFNPISDGNVSILLTTVGKVGAIIFSPEQIRDEGKVRSQCGGLQVLLRKVSCRSICRSNGSDRRSWTHWAAYARTNLGNVKPQIEDVIRIAPEELESRVVSEFTCLGCETHIAFTDDVIDPPPWQSFCDQRRGTSCSSQFAMFYPVTHATLYISEEYTDSMSGVMQCGTHK